MAQAFNQLYSPQLRIECSGPLSGVSQAAEAEGQRRDFLNQRLSKIQVLLGCALSYGVTQYTSSPAPGVPAFSLQLLSTVAPLSASAWLRSLSALRTELVVSSIAPSTQPAPLPVTV